MVKPISLSVHKNTLEQRRRKICRKMLINAGKDFSKSNCTEGFFIVSWDKSRDYLIAYHDPNRIVGMSALSNFVGGVAARHVAQLDQKNDD